ncbi:MAG TPA: adenosine deaminase [Acetobacteraceae bacterium]|jgi:adenosine deaminase|nr:adenosine deaminase [Acetobacteraceae bacterium]
MQPATDIADLDAFIQRIPKAELHMHLEGSIEAEHLLALAVRNGMRPRWETAEALRAAYRFSNLQSFLDLYYEGCRVLVHERDFYEITRAYLRRAHADAVVRAEVFVGPQGFTERGVPIAAVMDGVLAAMRDAAREHGISAGLLVSAQRHRSEAEALQLLDQVMPWADQIAGFGLGGAELGHPPSDFVHYFRACRERGYRITAHAGEEGPASYVREAVELLNVDRIDHGNTALDDPALVRELAVRATPLTVCPLSNVRLQVVPSLAVHPLRAMLDAGLCVTLNSDDPAYFGGYINETFIQCRHILGLSADDIVKLARNSLTAAFVPPAEVARNVALLDDYVANFRAAPEAWTRSKEVR